MSLEKGFFKTQIFLKKILKKSPKNNFKNPFLWII